MSTTFLLSQNVYFCFSFSMRLDCARCCQNLPPLYLLTVYASQQYSNSIASFCLCQCLMEHLQADSHRFSGFLQPYYFHLIPRVNQAALYSSCGHSPSTFNAKNVLYRHQERLIFFPPWHRNILIHGIQQVPYLSTPLTFPFATATFESLKSTHPDYRHIVARKAIFFE